MKLFESNPLERIYDYIFETFWEPWNNLGTVGTKEEEITWYVLTYYSHLPQKEQEKLIAQAIVKCADI